MTDMIDVDALAQEIRRVNGSNSLGAAALAEAIMPFISAHLAQNDGRDAARYRWLRNEAWGCDKINRKLPRVGVFDAIARFTDLAEEALDATLDAARNQETGK